MVGRGRGEYEHVEVKGRSCRGIRFRDESR
jgi:hypothetical protein